MLMKKRKSRIDDDDDGNALTFDQPKIDLPPGVVWPDSPRTFKEIPQEVY
jgi:hypothetical protein